ncbi:M23 family metallopeptidase [Streptomyces oceani]|uniref:Peptidase n=1 Tax=Streptomyces oceani TaxID=1075402 RepID=A0A1E7KL65_9ACTN|nr:M23 family metallopeptidase [Streptomyces oceani]OEV04630.1 peptidase [Streptomyces oceani]
MAFTRPTGKHRRPTRADRKGAQVAGLAGLATVGAVGSLASPAMAATGQQAQQPAHGGLTQTVTLDDGLAVSVNEQANNQQSSAVRAEATAAARADAKEHAAESKKKAEAEARKRAAERAEARAEARAQERVEERAARSAEPRSAVGGYVAPIAGGSVSTEYGSAGGSWSSGQHTGADFSASSGTAVQSVTDGEVVEAGWSGSYGYRVVIQHEDGMYTQYAHLSSLQVSAGQQVGAGQQIALSGSTGNSSGPHLHFEVRSGAEYGSDVDPLAYLRQHGVNV